LFSQTFENNLIIIELLINYCNFGDEKIFLPFCFDDKNVDNCRQEEDIGEQYCMPYDQNNPPGIFVDMVVVESILYYS
jgi:hypothetical protein